MAELPAQAISIAVSTPLNFIGNKLWSFAHRGLARLRAAVLAALAPPCSWPGPPPRPPICTSRASQTDPPRFFVRSAKEVDGIAERASKVREARRTGPLDPTAYTNGRGPLAGELLPRRPAGGPGAGGRPQRRAARAVDGGPGGVDDGPRLRGRLRAQDQRALRLAAAVPPVPRSVRATSGGRFGCSTSTCWCCSSFGVSHVYFNRGEIGTSVPLVYPVLLYLLARVLLAGLRPRARARAAGAARVDEAARDRAGVPARRSGSRSTWWTRT